MAAKFVVALACFALCNASPAYYNRYIFRNGRGYSVGQGFSNSPGGQASGTATINGGVLQAHGSASSADQIARNAFGAHFPGEVVAKAEVYDGPEAPVQNTPTFYTMPVISYQQNFETPAEVIYEYPGNVAQSSAVINDNSESITSARTEGMGSAEAQTIGSGYGTASSNVNGYQVARTQGFGSASSNSQTSLGLTSATSQSNGGYASSTANNALNSAVVSTNSQGIASSKADVSGFPSVVESSARTHDLKGIHWKFGTAYNVPTPSQAQVSSQANGGIAKSTAHTDGVVTIADTQGYGSANANANTIGGYINSAANSNGFGLTRYSAGNELGASQSTINNGLGNIKSFANSNGFGNANSHADINEQGSLSSVSNSNGYGTAGASANSAPSYAMIRADGFPYIYTPGTSVVTQTSGQGSASARTQGLNSGYRVVNSAANSFGRGAAQANASA